jgi:glycosyltransferase involved in cell wall biosynthesis
MSEPLRDSPLPCADYAACHGHRRHVQDTNYILITSYSPARTSGRGLRTCGIISALARNGRVTVGYVPFGGEAPAADLLTNERITLLPITPSRGLRRLLLALSAVMRGAPWGLAKTVSPEVVNAVNQAGPQDRIIADGPTVATALLPVARHRDLVYLAHNLESSFRGTAVLRRFERRILRTFDESWMATQADIDQARSLVGPSLRARYVPNVVDVAAAPISRVQSDTCNVLFVADFSYPPNRRGLTYLLDEVMPLVWDRLPEARLLVVGRGLEQPLEEARVQALGFVEDLEPVYAQASCVVVPLLEGGGSPLKFIEAMAHGLPVIATPRAAAGLQVVADKHFRQAESAESFAQAMVDVLQGGGHELGVRARELAKRSYSIESLTDILAGCTGTQSGEERQEPTHCTIHND